MPARRWLCAVLIGFAAVAAMADDAPSPPFPPPPADADPLLEPPPGGLSSADSAAGDASLSDALPGDDVPGFTAPPPLDPTTTAPPASPFPDASPEALPVDAPPQGAPPEPRRPSPSGSETPAADGTVSVLAPSTSSAPSASSTSFGPRLQQLPPSSSPPDASSVAPPTVPPAPSPAAVLLARGMTIPSVPGSAATPATTRPLTLLESLERSGDRSRRLWITQAYWKLAAAAARHRFAIDAEERLTLIAPGGDTEDLPLLDFALAEARGEAASTGVEFVTAQQELIDLVRLPVVEPAPWPADHPLTAAYQTHFETIFATRPATGRIRAIHRQLPLAHRALVARAEAAAAAEERFAALEALHARGRQPIGAVLTAHERISEQEEAFVEAIRGYNLAIAEYVMAVADLSVPEERFAAMLIGQPLPWRQPAVADRVVPVSASAQPLPQGADPAIAVPPRFLPPPAGFVPVQPRAPAAAGAFPSGLVPPGG